MNTSELEELNQSKLDLNKKSHQDKFIEGVELVILETNLDIMINSLNSRNSTREELKIIDQIITQIMNNIWKQIENSNWIVPFSITKINTQSELLYYKARKSKIRKGKIDLELLE